MVEQSSHEASRWGLIRDLLLLQVKLAADTLRDVVLAPVALIAGLVDLLRPGAGLFGEVLAIGRRTERWINLFGQERPEDAAEETSIDELARSLEARIRKKYEEGGITAQAKEAVDRALDAVTKRPGGDR